MLNTNLFVVNAGRTEYVPYEKSVTIHEHKAPTDDSIKLYEDIKEKAYNSIIRTIQSDENDLVEYTAAVYQDLYTFDTVVKFRFVLNGTEFIDSITLTEDVAAERDVVNVIYDNISKKIAYLLMHTLSPSDVFPSKYR